MFIGYIFDNVLNDNVFKLKLQNNATHKEILIGMRTDKIK